VLYHWLEVFPNTFFGFTNLASKFTADQVEALKLVEENNRDEMIRSSYDTIRIDTKGADMIIYDMIWVVVKRN